MGGPSLPSRCQPKPEARRAGHASDKGAAQGLPRPSGGGLKGRVRLPLQGQGIVGGWIPRAAPWAEIGRALGAHRPISRAPVRSHAAAAGPLDTARAPANSGGWGGDEPGVERPAGAIPHCH